MKVKVFVSYVRENSLVVSRLAADLRSHGIDVWLDEVHLEPGDKWTDVIRRKISEGDFFLACFSAESTVQEESYMNEELNQAVERMRRFPSERKWLIPVLLSDCKIPDLQIGSGHSLRSLQSVDLHTDWDKGICRLVTILKAINSPVDPIYAPDNNDLLSLIFSRRRLVVGVFRYPPLMDYEAINGQLRPLGIYGELLALLAKRCSLNLEIVPTNLSDSVIAVEQGSIDFMACLFQTPRRSRRLSFTALLHSIAVGGVTLKSSDRFQTPSDLQRSDCMIAVCREEIGHEFATDVLSIPKQQLVIVDSQDIASIAGPLISGEADVALADAISCQRFLDRRRKSRPALKPLFRSNPLMICQNGFMLKRGEKRLAEWLDKELRLLRDHPLIKQKEDEALEEFAGILSRF